MALTQRPGESNIDYLARKRRVDLSRRGTLGKDKKAKDSNANSR